MANPEHLALLKEQGVGGLNKFKEEHPETRIDLSRAHLFEANLSRAHLIEADLSGAYLIEADLSGADLSRADLSGAYFTEADLRRVHLVGADLSRADLSGADLSRADLSRADLSRAGLSGADFTEASLGWTVFADMDLSETFGLETCRHHGPSSLDTHTLMQSGALPEAFLQGCGLPDNLIKYLPSLVGVAFEYYSCFISYASQDEDFARRLHADLQDHGVRCWFAPEDMKTGLWIWYAIDKGIRLRDKLLIILSRAAVASAWVETEVETALEEERERDQPVLFPVRVDDAVMETKLPWGRQIRNTRHIGDFCSWKDHVAYQTAFERLLLALKAEKGNAPE